MDDRIIADILSAQADRLIEGQYGASAFPVESAEQLSSLVPLLELAEQVQGALRPVEPDPVFVNRLSRQLSIKMSESSREMSRRVRRAVLVIAAALGSAVSLVSAVGILIYLIRHRGQRSQVHAPGET
jgi:hypothetical protein